MKKHFEQAIAFDRDSPLNQRVGLGKKYNELVDEYNALEEKYDEAVGIVDEIASDNITTDDQPATDPVIDDHSVDTIATEDKDTTKKSHKGVISLFGKNRD